VVETKTDEKDRIARILTVQRGVFSTEVRHTKRRALTLFNRLGEKATVYVRHTVAPGYTLSKSPGGDERLGSAHLFKVEIEPNAKAEIAIEEETPLYRTTDIRASGGMDLVRAFVDGLSDGPLKAEVAQLVKAQQEIGTLEQRIATTREQMGEFRARMDELHGQLVTLKAVKTAGPLMQHLEKKLAEVSDKLSQATVDVVGLEEKLMVARIHFQDGVAELTLDKDGSKVAAR
jgi:hypothetical protein